MTHGEVTPELFAMLLNWLAPAEAEAADRYETIRRRLIRLFGKKGCTDPELLADITITRVTLKLPEIKDTYVGEPVFYFVGVARWVYKEWLRGREVPVDDAPPLKFDPRPLQDAARECLHKCLGELPVEQRDLVLDYYAYEKSAKIEMRRQLADELGLTPNALRLRAHRIRATLEACVLGCMEGGDMK